MLTTRRRWVVARDEVAYYLSGREKKPARLIWPQEPSVPDE